MKSILSRIRLCLFPTAIVTIYGCSINPPTNPTDGVNVVVVGNKTDIELSVSYSGEFANNPIQKTSLISKQGEITIKMIGGLQVNYGPGYYFSPNCAIRTCEISIDSTSIGIKRSRY